MDNTLRTEKINMTNVCYGCVFGFMFVLYF